MGLSSGRPILLAKADPGYFYEDKASLDAHGHEAVCVFQDHKTSAISLVRFDAQGRVLRRATVPMPSSRDRAHMRASLGPDGRVAIVSVSYVADRNADIELTMVSAKGAVLYHRAIDPHPDLDGTPAVAWGGGRVAVAWLRGPYPTSSAVQFITVDAATGAPLSQSEVERDADPHGPELHWDGDAFLLGWSDLGMGGSATARARRGLMLARVAVDGSVRFKRKLVAGWAANPDFASSPHGIGLVYDVERAIPGSGTPARGVYFALLRPTGAFALGPHHVGKHPDPMGAPRKPQIAWNGAAFGVIWEVTFTGSVFVLGGPEVYATQVTADGAAAEPVRLGEGGTAGFAAIASTAGGYWSAFVRDRLASGKVPQVLAAKLSCRDEVAASPSRAAGPCDVRQTPLAPELAATGAHHVLALADGPNQGLAALRLSSPRPGHWQAAFETSSARYAALLSHRPIPTKSSVHYPTLVKAKSGYAAAWRAGDGRVAVAALADDGTLQAGPVQLGSPSAGGAPGLVWTPLGLVVVWAEVSRTGGAAPHRGEVWSAELSMQASIIRAPTRLLRHVRPVNDCALSARPGGYALVFTAPAEVTETSLVHFAALDDRGRLLGAPRLVSEPFAFLRAPRVAPAAAGGLRIAAAGPFSRKVQVIELDDAGGVSRTQRVVLESYGFSTYELWPKHGASTIVAMDQTSFYERKLCPPAKR